METSAAVGGRTAGEAPGERYLFSAYQLRQFCEGYSAGRVSFFVRRLGGHAGLYARLKVACPARVWNNASAFARTSLASSCFSNWRAAAWVGERLSLVISDLQSEGHSLLLPRQAVCVLRHRTQKKVPASPGLEVIGGDGAAPTRNY